MTPMGDKLEARKGIVGRGGLSTQGLGTKDLDTEIICDMGVGDWIRTGDNQNGDVFWDIFHESHDEPWQWFDTEKKQYKAVLSHVDTPMGAGQETATLHVHENNVSTRNNEYWYQRFGTEL